jgi:hypothetical protein
LAMSGFAARGGRMPFQKRNRSASGLSIIAAILALSLIALPADRALAYSSDGALPGVGSLDDYMRQGQPRDPAYVPQRSYAGPENQGSNGAMAGSRSQMKPAVMGAMILELWAFQRYQKHHHLRGLRDYYGTRHSRALNPGNSMPSTLAHGY